MAPQKGKLGTKGQKQIAEENKSTIKFYTLMAVGSTSIYALSNLVLFWTTFTLFYWTVIGVSVLIHLSCIKLMMNMAKTTYSPEGSLLDAGIDLNMISGFGEHLKDIIILTSIVLSLAITSNYFLLFWLLVPMQAIRLLWVNFLGPWFFQEAPPEVDEKKQKKMERKQKITYKNAH